MAWTDEDKQKAIAAYKAGDPTPENSTELIKEIAEEMDQTANGVRMVLIQAGVYVKKDPAAGGSGTKSKTTGTSDKAPRVSKESQIEALKAAIEAKGVDVDEDILSKLTGKAAAYILKVVTA